MNSKSLLSIQALIGDSIMSGCGLWTVETGGDLNTFYDDSSLEINSLSRY